jgi:hypothetical protein
MQRAHYEVARHATSPAFLAPRDFERPRDRDPLCAGNATRGSARTSRLASSRDVSRNPRKASVPGAAGEIPWSERSGSHQRRPVRAAAASRERGGNRVPLRLDQRGSRSAPPVGSRSTAHG